jgi:hypothetical protein
LESDKNLNNINKRMNQPTRKKIPILMKNKIHNNRITHQTNSNKQEKRKRKPIIIENQMMERKSNSSGYISKPRASIAQEFPEQKTPPKKLLKQRIDKNKV